MRKIIGWSQLLLLYALLCEARGDDDGFIIQEMELMSSADDKIMQKMDELQELILQVRNGQTSADTKVQQLADDLNRVQMKTESWQQDNAKALKKLADPSHQDRQCNCVLEKLAPMSDQILQSTDLIKGLVENSTDLMQQVQNTIALVQGNAHAVSGVNESITEGIENKAHLTEVPTEASSDNLTSNIIEITTTDVTAKCYDAHSSVDKSKLIFGKEAVFYYSNTAMSWSRTSEFCQSIRMKFAIVKTAAEVSEIQGNIPMYQGYGVWVAASNAVSHQDIFYWSDNTVMTNTLWRAGAPVRFLTVSKACVWLEPVQGKFGDYPCDGNSRPLCQAPYNGHAVACS